MSGAVEHLRRIPIFGELDEDGIGSVAACAMSFDAEAGQALTQPGADSTGLFVLTEGEVTVELPTGRTVDMGPGEVFGELSLLTSGHRTGRVKAKTDLRGFAISRTDFESLLEKQPRIAVAMLPVLARRLAAADA